LPDYLDLSFYSDVTPQFAVLASVDYTRWHLIDKLVLNYSGAIANPNNPLSVASVTQVLNFKDTFRYSLGANYKITPCWLVRTGVAYDQSPVREVSERSYQLPDTNRYWLALGTQYIVNRHLKFDVAYAHLILSPTSNSVTQQNSATANSPMLGITPVTAIETGVSNFRMSVNDIGVQATLTL
jgi:long-chain fatty acid transport protein